MTLKPWFVGIMCLSLAGCGTSMARLGSYGMDLADAKATVDGREFALQVHPKDQTILVQRGFGALMGQSFVEGATLGMANYEEPEPYWRRAAEWLLAPTGCTLTDFYRLERTSWEGVYVCPEGVDLRQLVATNRSALREGQPLPRLNP